MIRKLLFVAAAATALATVSMISQPVQASTGLTGKAHGLSQAAVSKRSAAHLNHKINHWAHKNGLKTVRVSSISTSCSKGKAGVVTVCTSSARVAR